MCIPVVVHCSVHVCLKYMLYIYIYIAGKLVYNIYAFGSSY